MTAVAFMAARHGLIQSIIVDPLLHWDLWPLARTGASDTCVARGSEGESRGGEGVTSLSACLWSVQPQLRSRVWPPGQWGYWELLTLATGHLTLLSLGLGELSLVQDPVAVAYPPPHAWSKKRSGPNKRGQGSSGGRFMSLCSSNSLLAGRLSSKLWLICSWWMMNLYSLAMMFLKLAIDIVAKKRLNSKMWRKWSCQQLYMLNIELTLLQQTEFSLVALKRGYLHLTGNNFQDKQPARASAQFRVLKMQRFMI